MSSYHSSFKYLNKKSDEDFGWIISHFDPDNGETDSYLSQDQVYTDSYNGHKRTLYGTKYNTVANVKITVIKQDGSDFSLGDCRSAYRWLTGNPEASWMDLYIGDEVKYRLLCTIQDVKPQKMDARTIGLNIYCESLSPWAYSPMQTVTQSFDGGGTIEINNESDDMYSFVYPKVTFSNRTTDYVFRIANTTTGETTEVNQLVANEVITLESNQLITSDKPNKIFGSTFNFIWPRFKAGVNNLNITGQGDITFEYYYPIKMGDCAQNINIVRDPICDDFNNIQVDTLPFARISDLPTTLKEHNIQDAYTKLEVDSVLQSYELTSNKISDIRYITNEQTDYPSIAYLTGYYYTFDVTDELLANKLDAASNSVQTNHIADGSITLAKLSDEVITSLGSGGSGEGGGTAYVEIDEQELNDMLAEVLGE
jgi:hypothetical protein